MDQATTSNHQRLRLTDSARILCVKPAGFGAYITIGDGEEAQSIVVSGTTDPARIARDLEAAARELAESWEARAAS